MDVNFQELSRFIGSKITVNAKIEKIKSINGIKHFVLNDGKERLDTRVLIKPGTLPQVHIGDKIEAVIKVNQINNKITGDLISYNHNKKEFLIQSENLNRLKPLMIRAANLIRKAINNKQPIIIRHHNDTDGYCAAFALEKAILPMIEQMHGSKRATYIYYHRSPSRSPYYDYSDATRDINDKQNPPLIILCDLGDSSESMLAVKKAKIYNANIIIIDHHHIDEVRLQQVVDIFVNPFLTGFDQSLVTGMICTEIARMLYPVQIKHIPALAGTGDKSEEDEFNRYLNLCGYDEEYLKKWSLCIDFEAAYTRFSENREIFNDLLSGNEKTQHLVELIYEEIQKRFADARKAIEQQKDVKVIGAIKLISVDLTRLPNTEFPNNSKYVRIAHESESGVRVTIGTLPDIMIFRVDGSEFKLNQFINHLKRAHEYISGGGHDFAGTIKFFPGDLEIIRKELHDYLVHIKPAAE